MRGRTIFIASFLLFLMLFMWGCPKKVGPPPIPPPIEKIEPQVKEPVVEPPPIKPALNLRPIYFDFDKYDLTKEGQSILTDNAKQLMDNQATRVRIEGNCDERGTSAYNLSLGQRRADSAKNFLAQYGISAGRIETISYGEEKPVCKEHSEDCWWRNRRADFVPMSK